MNTLKDKEEKLVWRYSAHIASRKIASHKIWPGPCSNFRETWVYKFSFVLLYDQDIVTTTAATILLPSPPPPPLPLPPPAPPHTTTTAAAGPPPPPPSPPPPPPPPPHHHHHNHHHHFPSHTVTAAAAASITTIRLTSTEQYQQHLSIRLLLWESSVLQSNNVNSIFLSTYVALLSCAVLPLTSTSSKAPSTASKRGQESDVSTPSYRSQEYLVLKSTFHLRQILSQSHWWD